MALSVRSFFLLVLVMIVIILRAINAIESNSAKRTRYIVPGAYIVEFSSSLTRLRTINHHELFYRKIANTKTVVTPCLNFTSHLFIGASFHLNNHDDVFAIAALDSVSAIWPVTIYSRPVPSVKSIINLSELVNETHNGTYTDLFAPHVMSGVDKLHAQGYKGEGIFIAIIDTGVDYRHPALGGGFGLGYQIQYGYDFVGDNYTGYNVGVPDPDPFDCNGHGTHVTGIIGANAPTFTGVAPNAILGMYRVFGCNGGVGDDILIAAFSAAYQDGAQIITASLGDVSGWTEDPLTVVVSRIVRAGVSCTVAAGNRGNNGLFFASTPANGIDVTAVGSVDSTNIPGFMYEGYFAVNSELNTTFQYFPANKPFPANISGYPLYALGFNTSNPADACIELTSDTPVLSEKIVLIRRGTCTFLNKIANVQKFGAQYVIFYNNENFLINPQSSNGVLAAMVSAELGVQWVAQLEQKHTVNFYFATNSTGAIIDSPNNVTGGTMSIFSSWSPTNELYVKPEISAPGGNILSTYPINLGAYAVLSGTSMATPYIAGVLALYISAKGPRAKIDYWTLRQILSTTATPLFFNDGNQTYPYLAPVVQQGGGLVNAFAAVHYTTVISPSTLALNDTVHFNQTVEFTISNTESTDVSYTLTHQGAATAYTLVVNSTFPQSFPPQLSTQYAIAIISPFALTIPGNSTAVMRVTFSPPMLLETKRVPVFSGYINIQSSKNESFHLPYIGIGCSMKDVIVTDFESRSPYVSNSSDNSTIPKPIFANQTFNVTTDRPNFNWRLVMSSSLIRLDILGSGNQTEITGVNILGSVPGFPWYWVPRNDVTIPENHYNVTWNGTLDTGVQVPAGNYMFLYRALKIFGDQNNTSDYESWTSPVFAIEYNTSLNTSSDMMKNKAQVDLTYSIKISFFLIGMSFLSIPERC